VRWSCDEDAGFGSRLDVTVLVVDAAVVDVVNVVFDMDSFVDEGVRKMVLCRL
jgi:hypothetical protein